MPVKIYYNENREDFGFAKTLLEREAEAKSIWNDVKSVREVWILILGDRGAEFPISLKIADEVISDFASMDDKEWMAKWWEKITGEPMPGDEVFDEGTLDDDYLHFPYQTYYVEMKDGGQVYYDYNYDESTPESSGIGKDSPQAEEFIHQTGNHGERIEEFVYKLEEEARGKPTLLEQEGALAIAI